MSGLTGSYYGNHLAALRDKQVFFVSVGAMDGISHDELYPHASQNVNWSGLLIEPIPSYFEELKTNYKHRGNLIFENVAISDTPGQKTIYTVDRTAITNNEVPFWCNGISTFNPDGPTISAEGIKDKVQTQEVTCTTFTELVEKHQIEHIDILQIDAEGHDFLIFNQMWDLGFRPKVIHIEIVQMLINEQQQLIDLLLGGGYEVEMAGDNLTAALKINVNSNSKLPRVAFFTLNSWAFGSIHSVLVKELYKQSIDADLLNWREEYVKEDFEDLRETYDLFITSPGYPIEHLHRVWGIPYNKIAGVTHGRNELVELKEQNHNLEQIAGFACVASSLRQFALELGITKPAALTRNGIQFDRFYQQPSHRLSALGYAGSPEHVDNAVAKDCKRGYLAEQIAKNLGLPLHRAYYRHFLRMPLYYGQIDCIVVPSDQNEACGLPLMEGAAAGRLPVSAKVGIAAEFPWSPGLTLPVNETDFVNRGTDFLLWLLENPQQFKAMCEEAQTFAYEHYDWKNVIHMWTDFIHDCLGG